MLCRALPVVSIRRIDVPVLLRILFSYSAEVAWKGFLTAWGELFCFCPAARCCSLIGPPVTIRNMVEGGASHSWSRNNRRAVLATCSDGGWEHPVRPWDGALLWSSDKRCCDLQKPDWRCVQVLRKSVYLFSQTQRRTSSRTFFRVSEFVLKTEIKIIMLNLKKSI